MKPDSCELRTPTKNLTQSGNVDLILKKLSTLSMIAAKKLSTRKQRTHRNEIPTSSPYKHSLVQKKKNTKTELSVLMLNDKRDTDNSEGHRKKEVKNKQCTPLALENDHLHFCGTKILMRIEVYLRNCR